MKIGFIISAAVAVTACGGQDPAADVGEAALSGVPASGVQCLRITASSPKRTVSTDFGVAAGQSSESFLMRGIPTGPVIFSGVAFDDACGFVSSFSVPSWLADETAATITPGGFTDVRLHFHGNGNVSVGVDFDPDEYTVTTLAGNGTQGAGDGIATAARFEGPNGVALDGDNLYIVDRKVNTAFGTFDGMTVRRLELSTGTVTTIAGSANEVGTADGDGALARFSLLRSVAVSGGLLYVIDRCAVRTISTSAPYTVTTLVGTRRASNPNVWQCGTPLASPLDLAVRPSGLYVVDATRAIVSKIDVTTSPATITTVAGTPDLSGNSDGSMSTAQFSLPGSIVFPFATDDIFFVGDFTNTPESSYGVVRRVSIFDDSVTTVAGAMHDDGLIKDGVGASALFNDVRRLVSDGNNLYIGDIPAVRRMDLSTYSVVTIAGGNTSGFADGPGSTALLTGAFGIDRDSAGKIVISDPDNFAIRLLTP